MRELRGRSRPTGWHARRPARRALSDATGTPGKWDMREVLDDIERWRAGGQRVALARVVDVAGSSPRDAGAAMAVNQAGEVSGSVSGGCVEGAVVSEALDVIESGEPRLTTFGYSDDEAFAVGLTCGGSIRIFIEPLV